MRDYWKQSREALLPLIVANVEIILAYPGRKIWYTVGELADYCRQHNCRAEHPETGMATWFDAMPRRIQYQVVKRALTALQPKLDRALGSDDGREVRVYALQNRINS